MAIIEARPGTNNIGLWTFAVEKDDPYEHVITSDVDDHEAEHAVPAAVNGTPIILVSVEPDGDSLGRTLLGRHDAVAAMGPKSRGRGGTSWDEYIVRAGSHNPESAAATARSILVNHQDVVHGVAARLHIKGTIYGPDVAEAFEDVAYPKYKAVAIDPLGGKWPMATRLKKGQEFFPIEITDPGVDPNAPKAKHPYSARVLRPI